MMSISQFGDTAAYLNAFANGNAPALLPAQLVAEHINVTLPTVKRMLQDNRLSGVRISKNLFISVPSLQKRERQFEEEVLTIERYLKNLARGGERSVFYEPVMELVGLTHKIPADRTTIARMLGEVSRRSQEEDQVLLSVVVHKKTSGSTLPSEGFFPWAEELGYEWDDEYEFVEQQTDRVLNTYKVRRLFRYCTWHSDRETSNSWS